MNIYDAQISAVLELLNSEIARKLEMANAHWEDVGKHNLVLRSEMAYELGAGTLPALSFLGITSSSALVPEDSLRLYGDDLSQITSNTPYARITLLRIDETLLGKGEAIYDAMHRFMNTRYDVNPEGFMNRISTSNSHEPVRVSRKAITEGIDFAKVAQLYFDAYKSHKEVLSVQVLFVTLPDFDYEALAKLTQKSDAITTALDHILRDVKMDCASCALQVICNEVEGLKEHHFS